MVAKYCTMASLFLLTEQWLNYGKEVFVYCDLCMAAWGLSMNCVL